MYQAVFSSVIRFKKRKLTVYFYNMEGFGMKKRGFYFVLPVLLIAAIALNNSCSLDTNSDLSKECVSEADYSISFSDITYDSNSYFLTIKDVEIKNIGSSNESRFPVAFYLSLDNPVDTRRGILLLQTTIYRSLPAGSQMVMDILAMTTEPTNFTNPGGYTAYAILDGRTNKEVTYVNNVYIKPDKVQLIK